MQSCPYQKDIWVYLDQAKIPILWDGEKSYLLKNGFITEPNNLFSNHQQAWSDFLPSQCINTLFDFLDKKEENFLFLHLYSHLDKNIIDYPWEYLSLNGQSTWGKLAVERYRRVESPVDIEPITLNAQKKSYFLNMFPAEDLAKPFAYEQFKQLVDFKRSSEQAISFLERYDLSTLNLLFIFAHGSEKESGYPPFLIEQEYWSIPEKTLSPVVLLLACANQTGNLSRYSQHLLENHQAITVICATGKINAEQILSFAQQFCEKWQKNLSISDILRQLQAQEEQSDGARRLRVYGRGDIYLSHQIENVLSNEQLKSCVINKEQEKKALSLLLERAVLYQQLSGQAWDEFLTQLFENQALKLKSTEFLNLAIQAIEDNSLFVKFCVYPFLIQIAEQVGHVLMDKIKDKYRKIQCKCTQMAATLYQSSLYDYRHGNYNHIFEHLILASGKQDWQNYQSLFYRMALSCSTDLLLAELGEKFLLEAESAVEQLSADKKEEENWLYKDTLARHHLRVGDCGKAHALMKIKKREQEKYDSNRELSWLLYISALEMDEQAYEYADEIKINIGSLDNLLENWGNGNSDTAYQLRALSLWYCLSQQQEQASILLYHFLTCITHFLSHDNIRDYAPIAYSLVFLKLTVTDYPGELEGIWNKVSSQMGEFNYYAELMGLYALLNEKEQALTAMKRFHQFRKNMIQTLQTKQAEQVKQLQEIHLQDLDKIIITRETIEQDTISHLSSDLTERVKQLLHAQIMPQ